MALKPAVSSAISHFLLFLGGATEMCRKPRVSSAIMDFLDGLCQVTYDTGLILEPCSAYTPFCKKVCKRIFGFFFKL